MDIEKIRRKRAVKVLVVDLIMTISVVVIVSILVAVVAGWRIGSDFTVEQNGLVSIKTVPTGVDVIIDDEKQFQATNMSKMLTGGEHKIVLQKEGYESWNKTVQITPGWLLRLEYPRLFKQDREAETLKVFDNLEFFYVSPDRTTAIYAEEDTPEWVVVSDFNGTPKYKTIDLQGLFTTESEEKFGLEIKHLEWSENNERILIHVGNKKTDEWGIIDLADTSDSFNLTKNYNSFSNGSSATLASENSTKITDAKFEDTAGEKVLTLVEGNLNRLDFTNKTSTLILEKVESFDLEDTEIIYTTKNETREIRLFRIGDEESVLVSKVKDESTNVSFALTKFNSKEYLLYTTDNRLFVYRGDFPYADEEISKMELILENDLGINPTEVVISDNEEFVVFREGARVVVYDAELEEWTEYDYGDEDIRFLDEYLMYRVDVASGKFLTWDFDSENVRTLVVDHGANKFDALISKNNKYFYFVGAYTEEDSGEKTTFYKLIREKL